MASRQQQASVEPTGRQAPSRADVARLAGVSPPTVSLVLNGRADQVRIAKATQERVRVAARTLRYLPNAAARAMRGQRHLTIGILSRRPLNGVHVPIFEDFVMGVVERAADYHHTVKFLPPVLGDSYDVVATLQDAQVDAILVHSLGSVFRSLLDWHVPTVFAGHGDVESDLPLDQAGGVTIDETSGLRAAARRLRHHEPDRIAVITGPERRTRPSTRVRALLSELGVDGDRLADALQPEAATWFPDGGYDATTALLRQYPDVSLLHTGNDWMAIGALRAILESGRHIPDDIEVLGFGDFRFSAYLYPTLTTIHWPLRELGIRAVDKLLAKLNIRPAGDAAATGETGTGHTMLPTSPVLRETTKEVHDELA